MKRINFKQINVETSIDVFEKQDLRKAIGEALHKKATNLAMDELARAIFKSDGPVEIEDADFAEMMSSLEGLFYFFIIQGIANSAENIESGTLIEE